jgi:membrane-bound lytic murein transglycosylase D
MSKNKFICLILVVILSILAIVFIFQAFGLKEVGGDNDIKRPDRRQIPPVYNVLIPKKLNFCGEPVPMDMFLVREFLERELTSNSYFHSSTLMLFKRANRWFPIIETILEKNNIPLDFKYLAVIESNLENSVSPAGAAGFWQILPTTAREYGLEVNNGIDERYHLEKATEVACKYLQKSFDNYGSWTLAAAAYNAGNTKITKSLSEQLVDNYYDLLLNQETERYIFRILAIKTIFENPKQYGFYFENRELFPPIPTRNIEVNQTIPSLFNFAQENKITYKVLKYFNPWLRKESLPNNSKKTYYIKVPLEGYTNYSKLLRADQLD